MSQTKKVTGDFTIDPTGNINLNSATIVNGDLTVTGTTTSVETTNTQITDRQIVLNQGESGSGVTGTYSGIEVSRGSLDNAWLVFDESEDKFRVSYDNGSTFLTLLTSSGSGTGLENVVEDTTPQLGGDLDINGKNIISSVSNEDINIIPSGTGSVAITGALRLNDQSAPTGESGATLMYAADSTGGGTGIHFVDNSTSGELVSKTKAIVFGLIF